MFDDDQMEDPIEQVEILYLSRRSTGSMLKLVLPAPMGSNYVPHFVHKYFRGWSYRYRDESLYKKDMRYGEEDDE